MLPPAGSFPPTLVTAETKARTQHLTQASHIVIGTQSLELQGTQLAASCNKEAEFEPGMEASQAMSQPSSMTSIKE